MLSKLGDRQTLLADVFMALKAAAVYIQIMAYYEVKSLDPNIDAVR